MSDRAEHPAVEARGLTRSYRLGRVTLDVLKGVSFRAAPGEFVAITGASGSGKSTLLHLLGLLDAPDSGEVALAGVPTTGLASWKRNRIRCRDVGFVFQFYHLLGELNVLENVSLPAKVACTAMQWPRRRGEANAYARELLERLGLKDRLRHRPKELSGGERQRVAIARALMNRPKLLLADEPTGNLDSRTGGKILKILRQCNERDGQTIVMVTHDMALAKDADRYVVLKDGLLVS